MNEPEWDNRAAGGVARVVAPKFTEATTVDFVVIAIIFAIIREMSHKYCAGCSVEGWRRKRAEGKS